MSTIVYQVPGAITDLSIDPLPRDALLTGANNGVRFLFDLANAYCWTPGTPTQGKAVKDMAEISADGQINISAGTLANSGNGIDLTGSTSTSRACVSSPLGMLGDLYADQEYILCSYVKMPTTENRPTGVSISGTFLTAQAGNSDFYTGSAEIAVMVWELTVAGQLRTTRPLAVSSSVETVTVNMSIHAGLLTQVAIYRTAAGWGVRLKSSAGTTLQASGAANTKSAADWSAKGLHWGFSGSNGVSAGAASARIGQRIYRGFVENTKRSGRLWSTVLDDDYARTIARGVYS